MPGIYGSVDFIVGSPSSPKPTRSGPCVECGKTVYRETYLVADKTWVWRCYGCDPYQPVIERKYVGQTMNPMGYVPRSYGEVAKKDVPRETGFDPALAKAIKRSQGR